MNKKVIRFFGVIIGVLFVLTGIGFLAFNIESDWFATLHGISIILMGIVFFIYGITGKSKLYNFKL